VPLLMITHGIALYLMLRRQSRTSPAMARNMVTY